MSKEKRKHKKHRKRRHKHGHGYPHGYKSRMNMHSIKEESYHDNRFDHSPVQIPVRMDKIRRREMKMMYGSRHGYYMPQSHPMIPNPYPYYEQVYQNVHHSPMMIKYNRRIPDERYAGYYPPFYGMPPVGTCPGCGGKTALIPSKTPAKTPPKQTHFPQNDYDVDSKNSPGGLTPLWFKHDSDSKHSNRELMYPNFMSPTQALKKAGMNHEEKHHKDDKVMLNFNISDSKAPFILTPTPNKKEFAFNTSGVKLYNNDVVVPDLNSKLFSIDLGEEDQQIANTINKSPTFEDKESKTKAQGSGLPRSRGTSLNKIGVENPSEMGPL